MTLPHENRKILIDYRLEKSKATFEEAITVANLGLWNLAANRLYYSTFYMAIALNLKDGINTKTHSGVYNQICLRYCKTGRLSKYENNLYRTLFNMRQVGDYDDLFDWEEEDVKPLIPQVEELLAKFRSFLQK